MPGDSYPIYSCVEHAWVTPFLFAPCILKMWSDDPSVHHVFVGCHYYFRLATQVQYTKEFIQPYVERSLNSRQFKKNKQVD